VVPIAEQFFNVAEHAPSVGNAGEKGASAGQVEQPFHDGGDRGAAGERVKFP
jgi:hypothetical protein